MPNNNTNIENTTVEKLYLSGQLDEAIEKTLDHKNQMDLGHFHYNLGSLYLKKGDLGAARINLEKAIKEGFSLPMAYSNLRYIKNQNTIIDSSRSTSLEGRTADFLSSVPPQSFFLISLLVLSALLFYIKFSKKISRAVVILSLVLSITPLVLYWGWVSGLQEVIVIKDSTVYQGPSKIYEEIGSLSSGSKVLLSKKNNNWYFIEYPESHSGWVERTLLGFY